MTKSETSWRADCLSFAYLSFLIPSTFVIRASSFLSHDHTRRLPHGERHPLRDRVRRSDAASQSHHPPHVICADVERGKSVTRYVFAIPRRSDRVAGLQRTSVCILYHYGGRS